MKFLYYYALVLIAALISPILYADIPPQQTYGLYNAVLEDYKHLSPFHGFVASGQNVFRYYYDYTQPDEPLNKLMLILFRLIDDKLTPQASDREIATHLNEGGIAKLLMLIEKNLDRSTGIITVSQEELSKQLLAALSTIKIHKSIKVEGKQKFIQILIDSLKDAGHWGTEGQHYPQFVVHDILLTFLFRKVDDKKRYDSYFKEFQALNDGKGILIENAQALLNQSYENPSEPQTLAKNIIEAKNQIWDPEPRLKFIITNYESLAYAKIKLSKGDSLYPPFIEYTSVLLPWYNDNAIFKKLTLTQKKEYDFSDCMETALRNLTNFIAYNSNQGKFEPIIPYYSQFNVETILLPKARSAWAGLVSDIPLVEYARRVKSTYGMGEKTGGNVVLKLETAKAFNNDMPWIKPAESDGWYYYELEPTLPNVVHVINKLFNLKLNNFGELLKQFNLECSTYKGTPKEQTGTTCFLTDKDKKNCTLKISPSHGKLSYPTSHMRPEWADLAATTRDELLIATALEKKEKQLLQLINLYNVNLYYINEIKNPIEFSLARHAMLIQKLLSNEAKFVVLQSIIDKFSDLKNDQWLRSFIIKILNSLFSLHDDYTTREGFNIWARFASRWFMFENFKQKFQESYPSDIPINEMASQTFKTLINNINPEDTDKALSLIIPYFRKSDDFAYKFLYYIRSITLDDKLINPLLNIRIEQIKLMSSKPLMLSLSQIIQVSAEIEKPKKEIQTLIMQSLPRLLQPRIDYDPMDYLLRILIKNKKYLGDDFVIPLITQFFNALTPVAQTDILKYLANSGMSDLKNLAIVLSKELKNKGGSSEIKK